MFQSVMVVDGNNLMQDILPSFCKVIGSGNALPTNEIILFLKAL